MASRVSWIGSASSSVHQVDRGLLGVQQLDHALGLRVHRAALGQIGHRLGDVEEARDPAGRRRVDHDAS